MNNSGRLLIRLKSPVSADGIRWTNGGMGLAGLRAKNHLSTLKHILQYRPDMVIFLMGLNDWNHHVRSHFNPGIGIPALANPLQLRKTLLGGAIRMTGYALLKIIDSLQKKSVAAEEGEWYRGRRSSLNRNTKVRFRPTDVYPEYKEILSEMSDLCRRHRIECVFVTHPSGYQPEATREFSKRLLDDSPVRALHPGLRFHGSHCRTLQQIHQAICGGEEA